MADDERPDHQELGDLHLASVVDMGGTAVLTLKGTEGTARVDIQEDQAVPFRDTAREVVRVYDADAIAPGDGEVLIGEGDEA